MTTIDRHREDVAALVGPALAARGTERITVDELAAGTIGGGFRTLASPVVSPVDLPRFENSQMDGFAVRSADSGRSVRVVAPIPAGSVPPAIEPGTAAPIMTGARVPAGADAIVPVEDVPPGSFPGGLHLDAIDVPQVAAGTFVRAAGSDLARGAVLAEAGDALTPAAIGLLASAGVVDVSVVRRPQVLVVSTGAELTPGPVPGDTTGPDDAAVIGDANGASLRAALAEVGCVARAIRVTDEPDALVAALAGAVQRDRPDLVLTTGGISMGAYEVVREALEPRGLVVGTVAMQPGGPQALGAVRVTDSDADAPEIDAVPVIAFPGNPVSALVSFEVFLRPLLAAAAGMEPHRETAELPSAESAASPDGKHQVRRGTVVDGTVRFVGGPGSHLLAHLAAATHLVHVPVGVDRVEPGDPLTVWRIR